MNRLPRGCKNTGGRLAMAMERCRSVFVSSLGAHGYQQFWPSALQLLETTWDRLPPSLRGRILSLNSPLGEPCCLRTDITLAAVSYLASHFAPQERPLRLCYTDRIYKVPIRPQIYLENFQIGAELLGWEGEGADIEILSLLLSYLDSLGLNNSFIVLGDVNIITSLLRELPPSIASDLAGALQLSSLTLYRSILSGTPVSERTRDLLEGLPLLKGDRTVLNKAAEMLGDTQPLNLLIRLVESLERMGYGDRVRLDLGLVRELNYYSGPIFDIYLPQSGRPLGGGGRYDGLLASYGIMGQALGFSLDLELLASESKYHRIEEIAMLWPGPTPPERAIKTASDLHGLGLITELSWNPDRKISMQQAKIRGCSWWIDLGEENVIDTTNDAVENMREWMEERRC